MGHAVQQFVETLRYKPEGRGFDSRRGLLRFFIDLILLVALWPSGRHKQEYQKSPWGVKAADA
jgi:hypothetical protein